MNATGTPRSGSAAKLAAARRLQRGKELWSGFAAHRSGLAGLLVLLVIIGLALLAPLIVPAENLDVTKATAAQNQPPSWAFPLGTDPAGRSVLAMLLWGARSSLLVGLSATALSMLIGTVMGMCAGHFSGFAQAVFLRVIDFFLVIPGLVLAIVLSVVVGPGIFVIILAIGVTSWAGTARLVRSQTLTVEALPYIERSWALGATHLHVIGKHVLPAVLPLVLANTTLTVGSAVIAESTLSFLGLGDPGTVSWGSMLKSALDTGAATAGFWWFVLPPGVAIVVVVLCFTLLGRALESVVNPALRGR
ncbi:ABC transporter permease [Arthrobacter russicus]|jgi:peptide/nickel transport system permease protein|uniref:Peptide/nickel transport system permease protein n=1 Tax=Arthrobacter russicus TaxID=172040 RepID=A0ABU1JAK9_9MICC|nr:ABC transporter permease [Arthrobacter russicus]MBQ1444163.1 ABC transporter permease [Renibacterium sp.]MDN5668568.1 ABC transporter permease [Renibacterium salmoninarum]MDR6269170.1 peptide/nickel transport system permease protein [Arthrobacter russicus]